MLFGFMALAFLLGKCGHMLKLTLAVVIMQWHSDHRQAVNENQEKGCEYAFHNVKITVPGLQFKMRAID